MTRSGANRSRGDNHGKLVSEVVSAATPTGFDSHGADVRSIAKSYHGQGQAAAAHAAQPGNY